MNVVVLRGVVTRVRPRELANGSTLLSFDVVASLEDGSQAAVPVAWWDPPTEPVDGQEVVVTGSIRRRFFRSGSTTASRTEVIAQEVVPIRARKRAEHALTRASARLSAW